MAKKTRTTPTSASPAYAAALEEIEACRRANSSVLNLSSSQLDQVPPEIGQLANLTTLYLSENQLTTLPPEIGQLANLTTLYLSENQLTTLPPEIGQLASLTSLRLGGNQLTTLPPEIGQLANLTALDLIGNQLTTLPPEIGQLTNLMELSLWGNQLTTLPPEIGQLANLTTLYLSENQLTTLPPEIGQLTNLMELSLWGNQLTTLPPEIGQLTNLTELSLTGNQLTTLPPEIGQLASLTSLRLGGNQLATWPPEIGQLANLTELSLWGNQLTTLPPEIGQLANLTELSLSGNQLTTLPPEIGQLENLTELDLSENQLTTLPPEIGQLGRLRALLVHGNPLPSELMRLSGGSSGRGAKLIRYLRDLARHDRLGSSIKTPAPARRFDEAKLLLVGPGNVGKTWLLQALQGKVPQPSDPTKGIEIAREPLNLLHPLDPRRTLHLTCWDFGGQEHFQVTHQIFFSAKAIYLLVWKPREGFDPEMEARLERIQLSAGTTAKVLIVSTHADGNVPAILGHDALKERFGDLIAGFYKVDSARGPDGTGITALQEEIAQAVAQLGDMDLHYPAGWHAACQQIRAATEPMIPMKQIQQICRQNQLDHETAGALATLLEVQGHAVYFPDAAEDADAGALADDNIVVLKPEWLAKAVGFVIEDPDTITSQGILRHTRLATIWKKNAKRDCPGYAKKLHGYLLWLMWKYDIAYKQRGDTSLVPELIARNRPDDLRWTPDVPSSGREVRAICRFVSEQSQQAIAAPKGVVPALTAAVHPLRQIRPPGDPDQLDRNWNTGFFIHSESRGDAYVELQDRQLHLQVRNEYPKLLLDQILNTLTGIRTQRWQHLKLDLLVPCLGQVNGKRSCPGVFRKEFLDERVGKEVSCQECGGDFAVQDLLVGFNAHDREVLTRLQQIETGQRELLASAHAIFMALDPENQERLRGPSLFTILPEKPGWLKGMGFDKVRLTCWCEHPDGPHPAAPIGSGHPPDYLLKIPQDWLVTASPYISWGVTLLKAFVPLAANVGGQWADVGGMDLKQALATMKDMASALPSGKLEIGVSRDIEFQPGERLRKGYALEHRPELIALRHIHDMLEEQVAKPKRWGALRPVGTKSGDILWLCKEHAEIQDPSPLPL